MELAPRKSILRYPLWDEVRAYWKPYVIGLVILFLVDLINVLLPLIMGRSVDALIERNYNKALVSAFLIFLSMLLQAVGRYGWRYFLIGTSYSVSKELRVRLYDHLQRMPLTYYYKNRTGDLMSRATNDVESVRMAVGPGILIALDMFFLFALMIPIMFSMSWKLSLFVFAFFPCVPFVTSKVGKIIDVKFEALQEQMSKMGAFLQENFIAIRLVKGLVLENQVFSRFSKLSEDYLKVGTSNAKYEASLSPFLSFITYLGTILLLFVGGSQVIQGAITVGVFIAFQRFVQQLAWPMEAIGWAIQMNREGFAAYRRLNQVFAVKTVQDVYKLTEQYKLEDAAKATLMQIQKLDFTYGQDVDPKKFHLHVENLAVKPGQQIGVVGAVGSGKTSLLHLMIRLYEPGHGAIFWKGRDVTTIPLSELRKEVASVEQQVFLFSESIAANLVIGIDEKPHDAFRDDVVKSAQVYDEVNELESGFATTLGERGVNLSGGQKQRLALARALVRKPSLLLLDDCFSAVDVEVEKELIGAIQRDYRSLAMVFVSHRLAVMQQMDEIWVMDQGKIVAKGTHDELLETAPIYQEMWRKQSSAPTQKTIVGLHQ